jgi:hypothetical protein
VKWYSQAMGVFADEGADEAVAAVCMKRAACWRCVCTSAWVHPTERRDRRAFFTDMFALCRELDDARGVVADCDEAAALGATRATLFTTRAAAYEQLGRFAEALADVNRVAALTPSDKVRVPSAANSH